MDTYYDDVAIAEGWMTPPGDTEEERRKSVIQAWQRLHDTGLAYRLQGWFGRYARGLLAHGIIVDRNNTETGGEP